MCIEDAKGQKYLMIDISVAQSVPIASSVAGTGCFKDSVSHVMLRAAGGRLCTSLRLPW